MNRFLYALAIAAAALLPLSTAAAPSPSPDLAQVLAAPPGGFTPLNTGTLKNGHASARDLASTYSTGAAEAENTLVHDGFVEAYAMTWSRQSPSHYLIEYVIAFEGGRGAASWLSYDEASAKSDPNYQHSDPIDGIDTYYGIHLVDPASNVVADGFTFVKGNDMFGVTLISATDDVLSLAVSQTKSQYASAPSETIPRAQWPENISAPPAAPLFGGLAGQAVAVAAVVGVVFVVVGVAMRARRPS